MGVRTLEKRRRMCHPPEKRVWEMVKHARSGYVYLQFFPPPRWTHAILSNFSANKSRRRALGHTMNLIQFLLLSKSAESSSIKTFAASSLPHTIRICNNLNHFLLVSICRRIVSAPRRIVSATLHHSTRISDNLIQFLLLLKSAAEPSAHNPSPHSSWHSATLNHCITKRSKISSKCFCCQNAESSLQSLSPNSLCHTHNYSAKISNNPIQFPLLPESVAKSSLHNLSPRDFRHIQSFNQNLHACGLVESGLVGH